jgi:hypothetical protein
MLATLCVALSLALFAMGGADPTGGFCLRTLSFAGPSAIMGPVWDMIVISYAVIAGAMCEDYGSRVNLGLLCPLLHFVRAEPLSLLGCDTEEL